MFQHTLKEAWDALEVAEQAVVNARAVLEELIDREEWDMAAYAARTLAMQLERLRDASAALLEVE